MWRKWYDLAGLVFASGAEGVFIKAHDWGWVAFGGLTLFLFVLPTCIRLRDR